MMDLFGPKPVGLIYMIADAPHVKIGMTTWSPESRLAALQVGNPRKLEIVAWGFVKDARRAEAEIHAVFRDELVGGEWFIDTPDLRKFFMTSLEVYAIPAAA